MEGATFYIQNCFLSPDAGYLLVGTLLSGELKAGGKIIIEKDKEIEILRIEPTSPEYENDYALTIPFETDKILGSTKISQLYGRTFQILKYSS